MGRRLVAYEQRVCSRGPAVAKVQERYDSRPGLRAEPEKRPRCDVYRLCCGECHNPRRPFGVTSKLAHDGLKPGLAATSEPQITGIHQTDEKAAALMLCRAFGNERAVRRLASHRDHCSSVKDCASSPAPGARTFNPLQQESRIAIHVLSWMRNWKKADKMASFVFIACSLSRYGSSPSSRLPRNGRHRGLANRSPLLVEHELGDVAIGNQSGRWRLAIVEIAHHDAPGEIPGADGHLAKHQCKKVVSHCDRSCSCFRCGAAPAASRRPAHTRSPRRGPCQDSGGEVLVDLGIARSSVVHAIEQWHGGWKCWMSRDGV